MHRVALSLFAILAMGGVLAGCDSSTPTPELPGIELTAPLADVEAEEGAQAIAIALGAHFTARPASGPVQYSVQTSVPGALVVVTGDTLLVTPHAASEGHVLVIAEGANGGRATGRLTVRILPRCPEEVPAGQVALFPTFTPGLEWGYAYLSRYTSPIGTGSYRHTGEVRVVVESVGACSQGTQRLQVNEEITWTAEAYNGTTWVPNPAGDGSHSQTYAWIVSDSTLTSEAPNLLGREGGGNLAPPPLGRQAPRFADPAALTDGVLAIDFGAPNHQFGPRVSIRRGFGPISYATTTNFGTSGGGGVQWAPLN